jgi:hypothetical protein
MQYKIAQIIDPDAFSPDTELAIWKLSTKDECQKAYTALQRRRAEATEKAFKVVEFTSLVFSELPGFAKQHAVGHAAAIAEAVHIVQLVKRGTCWCQMGIGNPLATAHSERCLMAQRFVKQYGKA